MRYIMGVDGGGSKTYTIITDEVGNKVGSGTSGCGNHQGIGMDKALANIRESIEMALEVGKLDYKDISFVQYGLAGADRPKDFSIIEPALDTLPFENWNVVCDTMEGLRTGSSENYGVVLVCGSGTNAAGRNDKGETVQTGGFGYLFGDKAGGFEIARDTFRSAIRSWELREIPSLLEKMVPEFLGYNTMEELYNDFLDKDKHAVPADLTIVLHKAASMEDKLAIQILENTGMELGIAAKSVIRRLGGFENNQIPIILVGSVVQKGQNSYLLNSIKNTIELEFQNIKLVIPQMAPVYGAVLLGMDHLSIPTTEELSQKFISYGGYQD